MRDKANTSEDRSVRDEHSPPSPAHTPSLGGLDLDALEKVAREASNYAPGDWSAKFEPWGDEENGKVHGYEPTGQFYSPAGYVDLSNEGVAGHIATFDPPTVLRLIQLARAAPPQPEPRDGASVAMLKRDELLQWLQSEAAYFDGLSLQWALEASNADAAARLEVLRERSAKLREVYDALSARDGASEDREFTPANSNRDGYKYWSPDTGVEWSPNHPVESGEVPDAADIEPMTLDAFERQQAALSARDGASEGGALDREAVARALAELEAANDAVAEGRTQKTYLAMIDDGQGDALLALDNARRNARDLLAALASRPAQEKEL